MSKRPFFCAFFLFWLFPGPSKAQYEAILNDPDVVWAAEIDLVFWIEPEFTEPDSVNAESNLSTLLKLTNHAVTPYDESGLLLANRLLELMLDNNSRVFLHPDSTRPLNTEEREQRLFLQPDTVTVADPVTGIESNRVVQNSLSPESLQQLRVRQLLFYRDKTDEFDVYTLAFAPVLKRTYGSRLSDAYYRFTPFWFKMPPFRKAKKAQDYGKNPHVTWARRMRSGSNMPHLDSLRPFKDFKRPVMQQYLNRVLQDPGFQVRDGLDWENLSAEARQLGMTKTDTVISFDPETYEEKTEVAYHVIGGEEVMQLRLLQDWFWDERRRMPVFQLYAFAPMENVTDEEGNLRFKRPFFWRLVQD